jgi:guanylate kinase
MRPGEENGVNYHFVDEPTFMSLLTDGAFLEHARVFNRYYGTSQRWVEETLDHGLDVILEIDWQGAAQIHRQLPDCVGIFILPPSQETLRQRLIKRGQDDEQVIAERLAQARDEISHYVEADYLIVNDNFDTALAELVAIVTSLRLRLDVQQSRHLELLKQLLS